MILPHANLPGIVGRDLVEEASHGTFDALAPRPDLVRRILHILLRSNKCNVVLVDEAGKGKTALVEVLAREIARGLIPQLRDWRLIEVRVGDLVVGTKYRGEFEERIQNMIKGLLACQPAILFIDEAHLIVGAGRAEGITTDGANLLKPVLGRGQIRTILATTPLEYQQSIGKDTALARRFEVVRLGDPSPEVITEMVLAQVRALEAHHQIAIPRHVVLEAIALTDRCMPGRHQPDKAVEVIDTAATAARQREASELELDDLRAELAYRMGGSVVTGIEAGRTRLSDLTTILSRDVVGQPHAISRVISVLTSATLAASGQGRRVQTPATFVFAGPSCSGKTALATSLAEALFGSRDALFLLDMEEYGAPGSASALVGVRPGYAGCDQPGRLTAWLASHRGTGIVLVRELLRAHPEVQGIVKTLVTEGFARTGAGECVSAGGAVVVLETTTVNTAARGIGFAVAMSADIQTQVVRQTGELLPLVDDVILFHPLGETDLGHLLDRQLQDVVKGLSGLGIHARLSASGRECLTTATRSADRTGHALRSTLQRMLVRPLIQVILENDVRLPVTVDIDESFFTTRTIRLKDLNPGVKEDVDEA